MELLTNILTTYGISYLICESFLLDELRQYIAKKSGLYIGNMIYCTVCISFWVGLILTGNILQAFAIMGSMAILTKLQYYAPR